MRDGVVLATAGHVDHGKTTLVGALTGRDTDRLAAEKRRGISIELGFAPLQLASGGSVSLVDVPGHDRFVRHMVAGVTGVDGFLLCVAADDGVMPQTREHMAVLGLLDINQGVVAITRSDLGNAAAASAAVARLLPQGTEIVPVCAPTGDGVPELREALERLVARLSPRLREGPPRLWVDRCFSAPGAGTVVTGTLWGGGLAVGDAVTVLPDGTGGRIRGLQVHDSPLERVEAGRVAVALAGVGRAEAGRGSCVVRAGDPWALTDRLGVHVEALEGEEGIPRSDATVQCFLGTHEGPGRVVLLDRRHLDPGEDGPAELRLAHAVCARPGDRLVLRASAGRTVAGARVVDTDPPRGRPRRHLAERLAVLAGADATAITDLRAQEAGTLGLDDADDFPRSAGSRLVSIGGRLFHGAVIARAREQARAAVSGRGATVAATRAATGLPPAAAAAVVTGLVGEGAMTPRGVWLMLPGAGTIGGEAHTVSLALASAGLRALSMRDLPGITGLDQDAIASALATLQDAGRVRRIEDLWFDAAALEGAWREVSPIFDRGPVGIGALRDAWGVGRRHALAIAGHLDDVGLTKREGDGRVLRRGARRP